MRTTSDVWFAVRASMACPWELLLEARRGEDE